jgi:hypothetical protein
MQRLDLLNKLKTISAALKSEQILALTSVDFQLYIANAGAPWNSQRLYPLFIESKSGYDLLINQEEFRPLLNAIEASKVYEISEFSKLLKNTTSPGNVAIAFHLGLFQIHTFHYLLQKNITLLRTFLLHGDEITSASPEEKGLVILEITDFGGGISLDKLSKIFRLVSDLAEIIASVETPGQEFQSPEIILLDSGSSSNMAFKTSVETAKSLFLVFKEVWDYCLNHKHYKNKLEIESLDSNLTILGKIKDAEQQKLLTPEKAKEYSTLIVRKTDELIGLKVLPKKIVSEVSSITHIALLKDLPSIKYLTEGDDSNKSAP